MISSVIFAPSETKRAGFTLIEIVMALAIIMIVGGIILGPLSQFRTQKTLDAAVEEVFAAFSRAHIDTISSLHDMQYGVHFDADQVVYFEGTTYIPGALTNSAYQLNSAIEIGSMSLSPSGSDVVFERLTGGTSNFGTLEVRAKNNPAMKAVVTVNATGAISL